MGGHLGITWVLAFYFLYLFEVYCVETNFDHSVSSNISMHYEGEPKIKSTSGDKLLLPPKLSKSISFRNIKKKRNDKDNICKKKDVDKICYFKWINGVDKNIDSSTLVQNSENKLSKIITNNNGWDIIEDYNNKVGLIATGGKDSFVQLTLKNVKERINSLIFIILRSYSSKWKNSKVRINVKRISSDMEEEILSIELSGVHESSTSLIYPYAYKLEKEIDVGDTMMMNVQLIDGESFKFTDFAFCYK